MDGIRERYEFDPAKPSLDKDEQEIVDRMDFELNVILGRRVN